MSSAEIYRQKADDLMRQATATDNLAERSALISDAVRWNLMAQEAAGLNAVVQDLQTATIVDDLETPAAPES